MKILFFIVAVQLSIFANGIHAKSSSLIYTDCGSSANITSFTITGCTQQPCIIYKGKSYDVTITAVGAKETQTLPYKVTTKVFLVPVTLLKGNACTELSEGKCPVQVGAEFSYSINVNVQKKVPPLKTKVKALVVDDSGNTVICAQISIKVK